MICEIEKCSGCFACYNICKKNSISMKTDEIGHIYPIINKDTCNKCGMCKKICPSNNDIKMKLPDRAYASWSNDEHERKTSTSGGIASCISQYIINNGGVVYGAAYNRQLGVNHIRVDESDKLKDLKGTKYVHSWINSSFKKIKGDLNQGKKVLFIGTPCQVSGLNSYLSREYENLITIDIVCHGVPPQKLFKEHIDSIVENRQYCRVSFRDKDGYIMKIIKNENLIYRCEMMKDNYYRGFIRSLYNRYSCNNCKYYGNKRVSDLTIGDFWGLGKLQPFNYDIKDGVSLILINTTKGNSIIEQCKTNLFIEERSLNEAFLNNEPLNNIMTVHKKYEYFRKKYKLYGFEETVRICFKNEDIAIGIKNIIKKLLRR